jgi:hypothetical protein
MDLLPGDEWPDDVLVPVVSPTVLCPMMAQYPKTGQHQTSQQYPMMQSRSERPDKTTEKEQVREQRRGIREVQGVCG